MPDILLSGDHEKIGAWRRKKEFEATLQHRPDLFSTMTWQKGDGRLFLEMLGERHKNRAAAALTREENFLHGVFPYGIIQRMH